MAFFRTFLALALVVACQSAPQDQAPANPEQDVTFRILRTDAYAAAASAEPGTAREARVAVASSPDEYVALWREYIGDSAPPAIDFARESAVFLLLGQRSTGGWSVTPESVTVRGRDVDVTAQVARPAPDGVTTMAFSAPFAVIAVAEPGLEAATWTDRDGSVVVSAVEPPR